MFGQLPPRSTGSLEDPSCGHQTACWPELPASPEVLPSGLKLRNLSILTVHKSGLALVWKYQPVGVFFASSRTSGQIDRKCGNPCVLDSLQAQGAGREVDRRAGIFLTILFS